MEVNPDSTDAVWAWCESYDEATSLKAARAFIMCPHLDWRHRDERVMQAMHLLGQVISDLEAGVIG